ncbi:MAG: acyl carrier protein [Bacteroidota bacterium]|nr:acyl carrier protein [Bacteroidota bacterium]
MNDKILEILNLILESKKLNPIVILDRELRLREDLGLDSFDLAELTVRIEDEFDKDIFENGLVLNIGQIIDILKKP